MTYLLEVNFSEIWAEAQGVLNWVYGILGGTAISYIIAIFYKIFKIAKTAKDTISKNTGNLKDVVREEIGKALPIDQITISAEALTKRELANMREDIREICEQNFEKQKENEEKIDLILGCLSCLKSIPDSLKNSIATQLNNKIKEAENKVVVSLIPSVKKEDKEEKVQPAEIRVEQEYVE